MPTAEYSLFLNLFKRFLNLETKNVKLNLQFKEQHTYLTEVNLMEGIRNVMNYDCPYLGKLLYLLLSKGFDKCKIGMSRLIQEFLPLIREDLNGAHNKVAFKIYDIDRDGQLNILNLMHLYQNINPKSIVGQEVYRLMEFYFKTNVKSKTSSRNVEINYEAFSKIVKRSVLVDVSYWFILIVLGNKKEVL